MSRIERKERIIRAVLLLAAFSAVSILVIITVFIFVEGTPIMFRQGVGRFLFGLDWYPSQKSYGLLPMIVGSLLVTAGALVVGVPFAWPAPCSSRSFRPNG